MPDNPIWTTILEKESKVPNEEVQIIKIPQGMYTATYEAPCVTKSLTAEMAAAKAAIAETFAKKTGGYYFDAYGIKAYHDAKQNKTWKFIGGKWSEIDGISDMQNDTQKVKGIKLLEDLRDEVSINGDSYDANSLTFRVFGLSEDGTAIAESIRNALPKWREFNGGADLFARPCPEIACHGFLESRKVVLRHRHLNSVYAELRGIYDEVLKRDKNGQLLLMPYLRAAYNVVLANGMVTIGAYHDGATANRKSISLPTGDINIREGLLKDADIKDAPFIELVATKNVETHKVHSTLVQLRNGPALPRCKDYLPFDVTIKGIYSVGIHDDMLEFMEIAKTFAQGTVVHCRDGGINSHPGIHCALNNVPFIASRLPKVGETWERNSDKKATVNRAAFASGIDIGFRCCVSPSDRPGAISARSAVESMLFILHSYPYFDLSDAMQARVFGYACATGVRFGMTASLGEARYGKPDYERRFVTKPFRKGDGATREGVYAESFHMPIDSVVEQFVKKVGAFGWPGWSDISDNVGGPKWHVCGLQVARLWNTIARFCYVGKNGETNAATDEKDCVEALNAVVNVSHNSNRLLTKFVHPAVFDIAAGDRLPFIAFRNVGTLYRLAVNRLPLIQHEASSLETISMEAIEPTVEDLTKIVFQSSGAPRYRRKRLNYLKEVYRNVCEVDFDIVEEQLTTEEEKERVRRAEAYSDRDKLFAIFRERLEGKVTWPITNGCSNCETSPFPGSYCLWYPSAQLIRLDPCCQCNKEVYGLREWKTVTIFDDEIPGLFKAREKTNNINNNKESEESEESEVECEGACEDCGLCEKTTCSCGHAECECSIECEECGQSYAKTSGQHKCEVKCAAVCETCDGCINSDCHCPKAICSCACKVKDCDKKFNLCIHKVNNAEDSL